MVYRVSKQYSNDEEGFNELISDVENFGVENFDRIVYGQGITSDTKVEVMGGERPEYDLEELSREIRHYPRTKFTAGIKYSGGEQELSVKAKVGPLPTVEFNANVDEFDHWEEFENFLSNNESWT